MRQRPTATLASVAAAALLAACGSSAAIRLRPKRPITHAEALAVAQAISLRHADAPTLKQTPTDRTAASEQGEAKIANCSGGENPALRIATVASPILDGRDNFSPFYLESFVAVWPTAAVAEKAQIAADSARGVACYAHALGEPKTAHDTPRGGTVHIGPARVSQLPAPILGAPSIAFQGTAIATETFSPTARQYVSPFYVDSLAAGVGPIVIGVQVEGYGKAPPLALGQRLLARLYDRAKARVRTGKSVLIIK